MVSHYMSSWTKGTFDNDPGAHEIAQVMVERCGVEILSIRAASSEGFSIILFREHGDERTRALRSVSASRSPRFVAEAPSGSGGGVAVMDEGGARAIVRRLVEAFGGWFLASDLAGDTWERIEPSPAPRAP